MSSKGEESPVQSPEGALESMIDTLREAPPEAPEIKIMELK